MSTANGTASAPLARNDYREGQVLRARDLERESGYFLARGRQHGALAHIPGILFGLQVTAFKQGTDEAVSPEDLDDARQKNETVALDLFVTAGAAIDGFGRLIIVPRREQLRMELALEPSTLRSGSYRLELVYDRRIEGAGGRSGNGCGPGAGDGGAAVVREGYRLRLTAEDEAAPAAVGSVMDGPPDAPEAEAPVGLGTVGWRADRELIAFIGYSERGRTYAGVRAQQVRTPDGRAELAVDDVVPGFAVRFADLPAADAVDPFTPGEPEDRFRVDPLGNVWAAGGVSVHPRGVELRSDANEEPTEPWSLSLWNTPGKGAPFVKYVKEYKDGTRELRVAFERVDDKDGKGRVVVGYVEGGKFYPAVVVYDGKAGNPSHVVVEVWGDLHVRGVAHLSGVQRIPTGGDPESELDTLLAQLAGPLGVALRAVLVKDEKYLESLSKSLIENSEFISGIVVKLTEGTLFTTLIEKLTPVLVEKLTVLLVEKLTPQLVEKLVPLLVEKLTPLLLEKLTPQLVEKLVPILVEKLKRDQTLVDGIATELMGRDAFKKWIIEVVAEYLARVETRRSLALALAPYLGEPAILQMLLLTSVTELDKTPSLVGSVLDVAVRPAVLGKQVEFDRTVGLIVKAFDQWYATLAVSPQPGSPPPTEQLTQSTQQQAG